MIVARRKPDPRLHILRILLHGVFEVPRCHPEVTIGKMRLAQAARIIRHDIRRFERRGKRRIYVDVFGLSLASRQRKRCQRDNQERSCHFPLTLCECVYESKTKGVIATMSRSVKLKRPEEEPVMRRACVRGLSS